MIVEIVTDDGVSGFGEALCNGFQPPHIAESTVAHLFRPMLIGRDPADIAVLHAEMSNRIRDYGRQGSMLGGLSAVDIALWDLWGKKLGLPIWALLGGSFRSSVRAYATGFYRTGDTDEGELRQEAQRHVTNGF